MHGLLPNIKIKAQEGLYQIDPTTSPLGEKIIFHSVSMITEIGFEKVSPDYITRFYTHLAVNVIKNN